MSYVTLQVNSACTPRIIHVVLETTCTCTYTCIYMYKRMYCMYPSHKLWGEKAIEMKVSTQ